MTLQTNMNYRSQAEAKKMDRLTRTPLQRALKEKVEELRKQPEFQWEDGRTNFALDADGSAAVRVSVANCPLDFDLWSGLRNPAMVGLYPAGFQEIWEFYANNRKRKTDETGRNMIFQVARPFEWALENYNRAVVVSFLLPLHPEVFSVYNSMIEEKSFSPWDGYCKAWSEHCTLLNQAVTRLSFDLTGADRVVVVMNDDTINRVSTETMPETRQGDSHGVCKMCNYSQRSVSVLTGLTQFGVSRNVFRDEMENGSVRRLMGTVGSLVIFDKEEVISDPKGEIFELNNQWRSQIRDLSDFTVTDPAVNRYRFCTYIPEDGEPGCGKCIRYCPSEALAFSSPSAEGKYSKTVEAQQHRFWENALQFDNGRCCDERGQLANLYNGWMCGRCVSVCEGEGEVRPFAAEQYRDFIAKTQ